jgi:nicotinamide riboside kinase
MSNKLVGFLGAPSSGKTTLAGAMKEYAYCHGNIATDVCTEYAREFVFNYGYPTHAYTQYRITSKQIQREEILKKGNSEYIFTDSPVWLGWIYGLLHLKRDSDKEIHAAVCDMYEMFVVSQVNRYHAVFYIKNEQPEDDGCRDMSINKQISDMIDGFVTMHKHLLPIITIPESHNDPIKRKEFVWGYLNKL